jgi:predicted CXXCH cytochrome family protein
MDVCAQCHLQTSTIVLSHSMLRPDRGPFSYVPGEPLSAFRLTFDRPAESAARFEIVSSVYRLRQSACFVKSAGKLQCTRCHDPHEAPRSEIGAKRYNGVCRQCHGSGFDRLVATGKHTSSAGCVDCHMPKRRTDDVVHAVMTDHYIQRRKPERDLLANIAERAAETTSREELVAYDPKLGRTPQNQLDLAVAQAREVVDRNTGILRLSRLVGQYRPERAYYYLELADALYAAGEPAKALPFYEQAARRLPASILAQQKLGTALMETRRFDRAEAILQRASPGGWRLLGQVYARQGKNPEAAAAFQKALTEDPDLPDVRNNLGSILAAGGDLAGAEREFRESMRLQPNLAEARSNLARVLSLKKDFRQAVYYFESAIRLKPVDATNLQLELAAALDMLKTPADGK